MSSQLPAGWQMTPISKVAKVVTGKTPPTLNSNFYGGSIPFVAPGDLGSSKYIARAAKTLSLEGAKYSPIIPAGSILFTCIGLIGKVGIASIELRTNQQINSAIPLNIDSEFLYYTLIHQSKRIEQQAATQVVPIVKKSDFESQKILVPESIKVQETIAGILQKWDEAIEETEALVSAKQKQFEWLLKRLISDQQGGPGWRDIKLGEVGKIHSGGTPSTKEQANWGGDIFWLTPTEVTKLPGKFIFSTDRTITKRALSQTTLLPPNCLIVCTRATLGECCINKVPMAINQGFKCIEPYDEFDVIFLYYAMQISSGKLLRLASGNTFGEVSKKDFASIVLALPPFPEQKRIAHILNTAQREVGLLKQLADRYRTQKRGLMQKLLTGAWRITG